MPDDESNSPTSQTQLSLGDVDVSDRATDTTSDEESTTSTVSADSDAPTAATDGGQDVASETGSNESNDTSDDSGGRPLAEARAIAGAKGGNAEPDVITSGGGDQADQPQSLPNTGPDLSGIDLDNLEKDWMKYIPFEKPYKQQVDAIDRVSDVFSDNGYIALEGACGTGKTLIALASAIHAIRNPDSIDAPDEFQRVLAVTPVKQQLKQFIDEVKTINGSLERGERLDGLVLRGKGDMIPYAREEVGKFEDQRAHHAADDLRGVTAKLVQRDSPVPLKWPAHIDPPEDSLAGSLERPSTVVETDLDEDERVCEVDDPGADIDDDDDEDPPWWDPWRALAVSELSKHLADEQLVTAGVTTPYGTEIPHAGDVVDKEQANDGNKPGSYPLEATGKYDPFYARFLANNQNPSIHFAMGDNRVLDAASLVGAAASSGVCPHSTMSVLISMADVIIGNYNHLFDPDTRQLTGGKAEILDEKTIAVVDEAHMIEERVRDMLSHSLSTYTLKQAMNDLEHAYGFARGGKGDQDDITSAREALREYDVTDDDLKEAHDFLEWVKGRVEAYATEHLDKEHDNGWREAHRYDNLKPWDQEVELHDAEEKGPDRLLCDSLGVDSFDEQILDTGLDHSIDEVPDGKLAQVLAKDEWLADHIGHSEFDPSIWHRLDSIARAAGEVHEKAPSSDREIVAVETAEILTRWVTAPAQKYFKEIDLEHSPKQQAPNEMPAWVDTYTPSLYLYNCLPKTLLANVFDELGAGILMSATLEPFDVFTEAVGLNLVKDGLGSDDPGRRVETVQYGLRFPRDNRGSWIVDANRFTYRNRNGTDLDRSRMTDTRETYADVLLDIASSPGNVLICMPSYKEARWAAEFLEGKVGKTVHQDKSSDNAYTDRMLEDFFDTDEPAVLVTSTRGTVTEGVDYDGDKLHTCAVVGISMVNVKSPRTQAVKAAYDEFLEVPGHDDLDGFDMSISVPAVRKSRQAFGRVIRGPDEVGARFLVDERYLDGKYNNVHDYLGAQEQAEFSRINPNRVGSVLNEFWDGESFPWSDA